ncbi:hypothetical protein HDU86_004800 [Geranomyces michiganensis]|nr:hypothetical protein HDU86_004800 [Geranomyces michiganensis]
MEGPFEPLHIVSTGEILSQSSRHRRVETILRTDPEANTGAIRGSYVDYLFCKDDFPSDFGWGTELGAAVNVGMSRDYNSKKVNDRAGLATVLHDMHCALDRAIMAGPFEDTVIRHLPLHGIIVQNGVLSHIVLTYATDGYYTVQTIDSSRIPSKPDSHLASLFARSLELVLRFRDGLAFTRDIFLAQDPGVTPFKENSHFAGHKRRKF